MSIRPDLLLAHTFSDVHQRYSKRDLILYALGVGLGAAPTNSDDLAFLLEDRLLVLPTFAVTLGSLGMWIRAPEFGVDFNKLVHYEQSAQFCGSLPVDAEIVSRARVDSLSDRGEGRGAQLVLKREICDSASSACYCKLRQTILLRGDGGFGGASTPNVVSIIPNRAPDIRAAFVTDCRAALIYRLSGDWNPLHSDPEVARRAGFDHPILHGLASYAIAGVAVARACGLSPDQVTELSCRFTGIVFPGDTLDFRIWRDGARAMFQAFVGDRKALDQGVIGFGTAK